MFTLSMLLGRLFFVVYIKWLYIMYVWVREKTKKKSGLRKIHCKSWQMIRSSQDYIITDKLRDVLRPNNFVDTTELILTVHLVKFLQFNFIRFWVEHLFFHVKMCCANGLLICKCNLKNTLNYASLQLNNLV